MTDDSAPPTVRDPRVLPSLTAIRAFAALAVVVHHTRNSWPHFPVVKAIGEIGWLGVPLFFILSGFVLMYNFDARARWSDFVARRLFRIYPLHLLTLCISLGLFVLLSRPFGGYVGNPFGTVLNFLLLHDLTIAQPHIRQAWNGVSWSLSCEFCFYLVAPLLFRALAARPLVVGGLTVGAFGAVLACAILAAAFDWPLARDILQYHPLPHLTEFALGALGAILVRRDLKFGHPAWALALMSLALCAHFASAPGSAMRQEALLNYLFAPGACLLVLSLAARDRAGVASWLHRPLLIELGNSSFALYMTHALVLPLFAISMMLTAPVVFEGPFIGEVATLLFVALTLAIASGLHNRFELPLNRALSQRYVRRRANGRSALAPGNA